MVTNSTTVMIDIYSEWSSLETRLLKSKRASAQKGRYTKPLFTQKVVTIKLRLIIIAYKAPLNFTFYRLNRGCVKLFPTGCEESVCGYGGNFLLTSLPLILFHISIVFPPPPTPHFYFFSPSSSAFYCIVAEQLEHWTNSEVPSSSPTLTAGWICSNARARL